MFNPAALKKVSHLLQIFSKRDKRFRIKLRSWDDFKQVPVSTRENIKSFVDAGVLKGAFNITATSGSSSARLTIVHSPKAYEAHLRRLVKIYKLVDIKPGDLCLNLCAYELNSGGRLMDAAFKAAGCGVIALGAISTPEKVWEAAHLIKILKPTIVNAYTNQLYDLFSFIGKKHTIRRCLVNGEPLWPAYQKRIEAMGHVTIHDHYGAMEISGLAIAIKPHDEYMKVVPGGLLLEILDDSGKISPTGKGVLLVTDSDNTCMPFIRYRLGDRVELIRLKGALMIKVLGRTEESLLVNGVVVMKQDLIRVVNDLLGHPRFFFVVDKHPLQYYDRLVINVVDRALKHLRDLGVAVARKAGLDNCIDIRIHEGTLPRTLNGKIKYFIDARKES